MATWMRRRKPPLRSIAFRDASCIEAELLHHIVRAGAEDVPFETVESSERQQVVADAEEDLGGALLHDDDDVPADGEWIADHVDACDHRGTPTSA